VHDLALLVLTAMNKPLVQAGSGADPGGVRTNPPLRDRDALKKINGVHFGDIDDVHFFKVKAFVHCRLDYCNSLLTGAANVHVKRLQSVQNATARLVSGARRHDHITPFLQNSTDFQCARE